MLLAEAAGYETNCDYVHAVFGDLIGSGGAPSHAQVRVDGDRHVVLNGEMYSTVADEVDLWLGAILAADPAPPWPDSAP